MVKYTPFPYQEKCISKGLEVLIDKKGRREVLVAPVGAGKAIIIAEIANRLPNDGNILVIQPNKELIEQNLEKIESLGVYPAVFSASLKRKEIGRIVYATPSSLTDEFLKQANIKYTIIDECDSFSRPDTKFTKLLSKHKLKSVLGLTASPIYLMSSLEKGAVLNIMTRVWRAFYKDICYVLPIKEVIENGRWSKLKYVEHEFDRTGLVLNSSGSDYSKESLQLNYLEADMDSKIIGVLNTIPEDEPVLIFVPGIDNVESLTKKIKGAKCIHSKTSVKDRTELIRDFKSGKVTRVINSQVLSVGFDYPGLKHIIDGCPTNSVRVYYQKIGRLVRVHESKEYGTVHDLCGNFEKFGKIEEFSFENIPGYGWAMFAGEYLVSGIPMKENLRITRKDLVTNNATKSDDSTFDFSFDKSKIDNGLKITFGKHKGRSFLDVYKTDKGYLMWLNDKRKDGSFDFSYHRELEQELSKVFK